MGHDMGGKIKKWTLSSIKIINQTLRKEYENK